MFNSNKILLFFFSDLCSSDQIDEVEIFSLLEEQLPRYKLRADSLTKFGGYQHNVSLIVHVFVGFSAFFSDGVFFFQDWFLEFPALSIPEGGWKMSKELAQETLNYFRK